MNTEFNVSVEKIQEGIDYLESEFMSPLTKVGLDLLDEYKDLNSVLQSEAINSLIKEQQEKLDEIRTDLTDICNKAKSAMDDSSKVIGTNQGNIDDTLSQV